MTKIWIEHPASAYINGYIRNHEQLGRNTKRQAAEPFGNLNAKPIVYIEDMLKSERDNNSQLIMCDFFTIGSDWFMSDKLVNLLVESGCKIERFEAEIEFDENSKRPDVAPPIYSLVNITDKYAAICREKSNLILDKNPGFEGWVDRIKKLTFVKNADVDHVLWHEDKLHDFMICCCDRLADAITSKSITGVFFVEAKDYKAYVEDQNFDF